MDFEEYDVIIVGLGCVGLSTAHYCAKQGLKVLGLEINSSSGEPGTSSQGYTRAYRSNDENPIKNEMMKISIKLWSDANKQLKELKSKGATQEHQNIDPDLLFPCEYLTFGDKNSYFISCMFENNPKLNWISAKEIMEIYPTFENIPESYIGNISNDAGTVKVKNALDGFRILAQLQGANLKYSSEVESVTKTTVTLKNGDIFKGNNVVICCGAYSLDKFDQLYKNVDIIETETFTFDGNLDGLPPIFFESSEEYKVYSLRDTQDLTEQKIGLHDKRDFKLTLKWVKERMPSKLKHLKYSNCCFYTMTENHDFVYKTNPDGVHYCYGLCGEGFKYMPIHGKVVYDGLVTKEDTSFVRQTRSKL